MSSDNPVETFVETAESDLEIPISHRLTKVLLAAGAGMIATWLTERAYDRFVIDKLDNDDDSDVEATNEEV